MSTDPQPEPPQTMAQELPQDFKMPDIVKTAEGSVNQRTVTWMNEVQSHLPHKKAWIRAFDSTFYIRTYSTVCRYEAKIYQVSKHEELADVPMKPVNTYIKEDLQPAIDALAGREKRRQRAIQEKAQEVTAAKKRKREEDQEVNKKLSTIIDGLHTLREHIDKKTDNIDVGTRRKFLKLESKILDEMVTSDSEEDDSDDD